MFMAIASIQPQVYDKKLILTLYLLFVTSIKDKSKHFEVQHTVQ